MFALLILQHDVLNLNIDLDDLEKPQDAHAGFEERKEGFQSQQIQ